MQFMEQHVWPLGFLQVIVDPHLICRDKFIDVVMPSFGEIDVKHTPH